MAFVVIQILLWCQEFDLMKKFSTGRWYCQTLFLRARATDTRYFFPLLADAVSPERSVNGRTVIGGEAAQSQRERERWARPPARPALVAGLAGGPDLPGNLPRAQTRSDISKCPFPTMTMQEP